MPHILNLTTDDAKANGLCAIDIVDEKGKPTLLHVTESEEMNELEGDEEEIIVHPLKKLVKADPVGLTMVPDHRKKHVQRVQKKVANGEKLIPQKDTINKHSFWSPVPSFGSSNNSGFLVQSPQAHSRAITTSHSQWRGRRSGGRNPSGISSN